jgi:hypothetical protein
LKNNLGFYYFKKNSLQISKYFSEIDLILFENLIFFFDNIKIFKFHGKELKTIKKRAETIENFNLIENGIFLFSQKLGFGFSIKSDITIQLGKN